MELDRRATKTVALTEGLLIYLSTEQVGALARDLAFGRHFHSWIIDLASPGQLRIMQRAMGTSSSCLPMARCMILSWPWVSSLAPQWEQTGMTELSRPAA